MKAYVGTSGWSYPPWRGKFYPEKFSTDGMLAFYSERLPTVEINNTFYRMPKVEALAKWAAVVPEGFRFAVKASKRISHVKRLVDAGDDVGYLAARLAELGDKLGSLLIQLPPFLKKDAARLEAFLEGVPAGIPVAFEFRNASWFDPEIEGILRKRSAVLCAADRDDTALEAPLWVTADWGYVRLRRQTYDDAEISAWADRLRERARDWQRVFAYFMHEDEGEAPELALRLQERLS